MSLIILSCSKEQKVLVILEGTLFAKHHRKPLFMKQYIITKRKKKVLQQRPQHFINKWDKSSPITGSIQDAEPKTAQEEQERGRVGMKQWSEVTEVRAAHLSCPCSGADSQSKANRLNTEARCRSAPSSPYHTTAQRTAAVTTNSPHTGQTTRCPEQVPTTFSRAPPL